MPAQTRARSFAEQLRDCALELGLDLSPEEPAPHPAEEGAPAAPATPIGAGEESGEPPALADLVAELEAVDASLSTVARQDQAAREQAREDLLAYDALVAASAEAERAVTAAREVGLRAEALAAGAFADEARTAAAAAAGRATAAEEQARRCATLRRAAVDAFARDHDLEHLVAARRREQEDDSKRAASAERAA